MRKNKTKILAILLFAVTLIMITAMTASVIFAALYTKERSQTATLAANLISANEKVNAAESENLQLEESLAALSEQEALLEDQLKASEMTTMNASDLDYDPTLRQKVLATLTAEDGSPIRAIRELFPENFIFYDSEDKGYAVMPVLDEIPKHSLVAENLIQNDDGEMVYVEDGDVVSYKGIDVSKYQGSITWSKVKSDGVDFAIIRLGIRGYESGKIVLDDYFEENIKGANEAGIPAGVYFFTQAVSTDEAIEEAEFVLENIEGYDISCPIVFDVEMVGSSNARANSLSRDERTEITIAFCEKIREAGYTPMIYGNVKCFTKMLDLTRLLDYEKWYAFYDNYMYMPYEVGCWQYSEKGTVSGIKEKVDLNISYKKLW